MGVLFALMGPVLAVIGSVNIAEPQAGSITRIAWKNLAVLTMNARNSTSSKSANQEDGRKGESRG